jgi:eukaryotic-like serine/threonine-protein kinase
MNPSVLCVDESLLRVRSTPSLYCSGRAACKPVRPLFQCGEPVRAHNAEVTNPPTMSQSTAAYQPGDTPADGPPSSHLLVGGVAVPADLRTILHKRLRVCGTIFTVAYGLILTTGPLLLSKEEFDRSPPIYYVAQGAAFVAALASTVLLWRRPVLPLNRLRMVELILFGTIIAQGNFAINQDCVENGSLLKWLDRPAPIMYHYYALPSFAVIIAYGIFIPNTGRRCGAVVSVMVILPVVTLLASGAAVPEVWGRPQLRNDLLTNVWMLAVWLVTAAAAAVYCSYRIETLRRDVSEARKVGQYVLRERLDSGGMGEVYRAEHALLRRPCAVKLIRPDRAGDPAALARFEREVQATATLAHPHIVRIFDYGRAEDGTFYCVMEYLPGVTLDELVRKHGPLAPGRVVFLLRQLCSALAEAHGRGLTHRDVKPGNVIVCESGRQIDFATLLDFGLVMDRGSQTTS